MSRGAISETAAMEKPEKKDRNKSDADMRILLAEMRQLYRSGNMTQAASVCQQILTTWPVQVEAMHLSGIIAHRSGHSQEAIAMLRQALEATPSDLNIVKNLILILKASGQMETAASLCPQALSAGSDNYQTYQGLGDLFCSHGYLEETVALYEKALAIKSDLGPAWSNLGNALQGLDRLDEAIVCYRKALPLDPGNAELYYNLGNAFSKKQMFDKAVSNYEKALVLKPHHAQAYFNMGNVFKAMGQFDDAIGCFKKCIQINSNDVDAHYNLANARYGDGQMQAAVNAYEETLRRKPDHVLALNNLGCLLKDLGADEQAVAMFNRSIEIDPMYAPAYINMGNAYKDHNDFEHAYAAYLKAISLEPGNQDALVSMGSLLKKEGRFEEGLGFLKRAVAASPEISRAWWYYHLALPILYKTESEIAHYRRCFSDGLVKIINAMKLDTSEQCKRALAGIGSTTTFYLQYQGQNDLQLQKTYGGIVNQTMAANYPQWSVPLKRSQQKENAKIRIGYVSAFLRTHTIGKFLIGWVESHNRREFEIYTYHLGNRRDQLTDDFHARSDHFKHLQANTKAIARQIRSDDLDVLVYTDIGMYAPATQLAGLRLAPVQCCWWGHPVTTGLETIDFFLSSDLMEPEDARTHYSEQLVRLPNIGLTYKQPNLPAIIKSRDAFGLDPKDFIYLSSQSLFKYLPQYDEVYPRIAMQVPNAKFVFIGNPSTTVTEVFSDRLTAAFDGYQLDVNDYCRIQSRMSFDDFLNLNQASDVLLDTFSWSGGNTTMEGIRCGLPVVTCPGRYMRGRHSYAMLKMMGITETIAEDAEGYITIACRLGNDRDFFDRIRNSITSNRHLLYNDKACIRELEDFYRRAVKAHQNELEKTTIA
jgi:protein O-GlcNAc transferase